MDIGEEEWASWVARAWEARRRAHAPYSGFAVGACVVAEGGGEFVGCNVENLSFGLTNCAERVAVGNMVSSLGRRSIVAVVVVTATDEPVSPCGACRQVLAEFGDPLVRSVSGGGSWREWKLSELLPQAFAGVQLPGQSGATVDS